MASCGESRTVSAGSEPEASTQANRAEGIALLHRMSAKIAKTQAMTFSTTERVERVRRNGQKVTLNLERQLAMKRPDRFWFNTTGDQDLEAYYKGKRVTLVSHKEQVWGEFPAPPTIDETVDEISSRYDIPMPIGDLLTVNPDKSLVTDDTTGGWAGREIIEGVVCDRLTWRHPKVDWSVWIPMSGDALPRKLQITYKARRGQPAATVIFRDWNLNPRLTDSMFSRKIPPDYEGIPIIQSASAVLPPSEKGAKKKGAER
jgi:hypothetical protein